MAHELENMAYAGETPWHNLGTATLGAMTAEQAFSMGGLDFEVVKAPLYLATGQELPENYAIVRTDRDTDNVLGCVGRKYTPLQNRDAFGFFDTIVDRGEAIYHTAGSLRGGRRIWLLAKLPGELLVQREDIVNKYLLLATSHDGSLPVIIQFTPVRVVCQNTLNAALSDKTQLRHVVRHTTNVERAVAEAGTTMGIANRYYQDLGDAFRVMAAKQLSVKETQGYLDTVFAEEAAKADLPEDCRTRTIARSTMSDLYGLLETGKGAEWARGTVWGAYNAATEYVDHVRAYKDDHVRMENVWGFAGEGSRVKQRAFDQAVALCAS